VKKLVLVLAGAIGLITTAGMTGVADVTGTAVVLSCNDGHSVAMTVDQATLTSLVADVNAINAGLTGLSCTLDTAAVDPSTQSGDWTVFDYNPSGRALAPRHSPDSLPATPSDGGSTWQFPFKPNVFTALFTTTDPGLTGDLCPVPAPGCKTLTEQITLSGDANTFVTQHAGGDCVGNMPAAVRFYFTAPSASGPSTGTPPAGFYTHFWWSNPVNVQMLTGTQSSSMAVDLGDPSLWSDWNGQRASTQLEAFDEAIQKVQSIGLSFGGECFFETGVTPDPATSNEQFASQFREQ
jgi:hypothetical protein